jgi:hypothetical protein
MILLELLNMLILFAQLIVLLAIQLLNLDSVVIFSLLLIFLLFGQKFLKIFNFCLKLVMMSIVFILGLFDLLDGLVNVSLEVTSLSFALV